MSGNNSVGSDGFFNAFRSLLDQAGLNADRLSQANVSDTLAIFQAADAADGKVDGKVSDKNNFLAQIKDYYGSDNFTNLDAIESDFLDAWEEWAGDDSALSASEISGAAKGVADSYGKDGANAAQNYANSDAYANRSDTSNRALNNSALDAPNAGGYQRTHSEPVSADSLAGKDSSTLRSDRSTLQGDIDSLRGEMETAKSTQQGVVDEKKKTYDEALKALEEDESVQDEQGNTLKSLNEQKTAKEGEITQQNSVISDLKGSIDGQKGVIDGLGNEISAHEGQKPNQSDSKYQKEVTTGEGEEQTTTTEFDEAAYQADLQAWQDEKDRLEGEKKAAEDELSQMEQQLGEAEDALNVLEDEATEIDNQINDLTQKIADEGGENSEAALAINKALDEYQAEQTKLETITAPYEADIAQMQADLGTYDTAITDAEAAEKEAADKAKLDEYNEELGDLYTNEDGRVHADKDGDPSVTVEAWDGKSSTNGCLWDIAGNSYDLEKIAEESGKSVAEVRNDLMKGIAEKNGMNSINDTIYDGQELKLADPYEMYGITKPEKETKLDDKEGITKVGEGEYTVNGQPNAERELDDSILSKDAVTLSQSQQENLLKEAGIDLDKYDVKTSDDGTVSFKSKDGNQHYRVVNDNDEVKIIQTTVGDDNKATTQVYKIDKPEADYSKYQTDENGNLNKSQKAALTKDLKDDKIAVNDKVFEEMNAETLSDIVKGYNGADGGRRNGTFAEKVQHQLINGDIEKADVAKLADKLEELPYNQVTDGLEGTIEALRTYSSDEYEIPPKSDSKYELDSAGKLDQAHVEDLAKDLRSGNVSFDDEIFDNMNGETLYNVINEYNGADGGRRNGTFLENMYSKVSSGDISSDKLTAMADKLQEYAESLDPNTPMEVAKPIKDKAAAFRQYAEMANGNNPGAAEEPTETFTAGNRSLSVSDIKEGTKAYEYLEQMQKYHSDASGDGVKIDEWTLQCQYSQMANDILRDSNISSSEAMVLLNELGSYEVGQNTYKNTMAEGELNNSFTHLFKNTAEKEGIDAALALYDKYVEVTGVPADQVRFGVVNDDYSSNFTPETRFIDTIKNMYQNADQSQIRALNAKFPDFSIMLQKSVSGKEEDSKLEEMFTGMRDNSTEDYASRTNENGWKQSYGNAGKSAFKNIMKNASEFKDPNNFISALLWASNNDMSSFTSYFRSMSSGDQEKYLPIIMEAFGGEWANAGE